MFAVGYETGNSRNEVTMHTFREVVMTITTAAATTTAAVAAATTALITTLTHAVGWL